MTADQPERERSFKVQDRRRFSETGDARPDAPEAPAPSQAEGAGEAARADEAQRPEREPSGPTGGTGEAPAITFAGFVVGLSTQALANLGMIPDPERGETRIDLAAARQIIDILAILQEKTRGNLETDEAALLEHALYDLRMKFVEHSRGRPTTA